MRCSEALLPGGLLLLEPQRFDTVEKLGHSGPSWYSCGQSGGLFLPGPHLCLQESFWHEKEQSATQRFFVIDAQTGQASRHALTTEAYTQEHLQELLTRAGFRESASGLHWWGDEPEVESQSATSRW